MISADSHTVPHEPCDARLECARTQCEFFVINANQYSRSATVTVWHGTKKTKMNFRNWRSAMLRIHKQNVCGFSESTSPSFCAKLKRNEMQKRLSEKSAFSVVNPYKPKPLIATMPQTRVFRLALKYPTFTRYENRTVNTCEFANDDFRLRRKNSASSFLDFSQLSLYPYPKPELASAKRVVENQKCSTNCL